MKRYGIEKQILLVALIPVLMMAVLLENYFIYSRFADLDSALRERSELLVKQFVASSEYEIFSGNLAALQQNVDAVLAQPDIVSVVVLDAGAKPLVSGTKESRGQNAALMTQVNLSSPVYQDDDVLMLYVPIVTTQIMLDEPDREGESASSSRPVKPLGAAIIEISKRRLNSQKRGVLLISLAVTLLVLMITLGVALYAARRIARPVMEMSQAICHLGEGNLDTRITSQTHILELSELATGFNRMAGQLQHDRQILESRVAERTAALAAREQESRTLIENTPDTIVRYDLDCRRTYVNPAFAAMAEGGVAALLGKKPSEYPDGSNSDIYEARIKEVFASGNNAHFELNWPGKDGQEMCSHIRLTAERDPSGGIISVLGVGRDITELNNSRSALNQANAKLENMNALLQALATSDPLTQLPNRRMLLDRLQQALLSSARSGRKGALIFIDLDNFKTLNDTLGHDVGDMLLQQVAKRLEFCVREGDTVARLGGDEFVVMLEGLSEQTIEAAAQTEAVGQKILTALSESYQLATHVYRNTPSIGATLFNNNPQTPDELMKQADIAMYQAKKAGRNTLRFFDPRMQETVNARAVLEGELRQALDSRQLQLHYQIQVCGIESDGTPVTLGAEALIRWHHPERGWVLPVDFIPMAEEVGLILPIGQWVLETACAQLKAWEQDALTRELFLSVNVSARQFLQPDFVAQVKAIIQRHAINPKLLKLELTENLLLSNMEGTIASMNALNEIGVQFSLDDFGTGYTSLQHLKKLPLNQLKVDQSFVRDLASDSSDKAVVRTIMAMADSLNLNVIAEGVETAEQLKLLQRKGCIHYQGYLFGKPVPIEEFEALLRRS